MSLGIALGALTSGARSAWDASNTKRLDQQTDAPPARGVMPNSSVAPQDSTSDSSSSSGSVAPPQSGTGALGDPQDGDLDASQKAFLNVIASGESGGKYNVRYSPKGAQTFDDFSQHPGIFESGPSGPSSAAGRYQFTKSTWDGLGGGSFDPANQDRMAWKLASQDYGQRTGRDLDTDLKRSGVTASMLKTLSPTWTSLGSDQNGKIALYKQNLARYATADGTGSADGNRPWSFMKQFLPSSTGA